MDQKEEAGYKKFIQKSFNAASEFMATNGVIQVMQYVLAAGFIMHIILGIKLELQNRSSRGVKYAVNKPSENSSFSSRNMIVTGIIVLLFLILHLKDFFIELKYFDKGSLATIGKKSAVADFGTLHIWGLIAWFLWSTIHLMSISGFKNKIMVGLSWASSYFTYDKGNRLIIRKYKHKKAFNCIATEELT